MESVLTVLAWLIAGYFISGAVFSFFFVARGLQKIDPSTKNTGFGFHLMMMPGSMAFWPTLLLKWIRS